MSQPTLLSAALGASVVAPAAFAHSAAEAVSSTALIAHLLLSPDHVVPVGLIVVLGLGLWSGRAWAKRRSTASVEKRRAALRRAR